MPRQCDLRYNSGLHNFRMCQDYITARSKALSSSKAATIKKFVSQPAAEEHTEIEVSLVMLLLNFL